MNEAWSRDRIGYRCSGQYRMKATGRRGKWTKRRLRSRKSRSDPSCVVLQSLRAEVADARALHLSLDFVQSLLLKIYPLHVPVGWYELVRDQESSRYSFHFTHHLTDWGRVNLNALRPHFLGQISKICWANNFAYTSPKPIWLVAKVSYGSTLQLTGDLEAIECLLCFL